MKVWIVVYYDWDIHGIDSIWSTKELALARINETKLLPGRQPHYDYEEHEVDYV